MSSRRKQLSFLWYRFKGFWNQYRQSKRGMLGIIIIAFFAIVAIAAPLLSPLDPMKPTWPGYYPGGQPRLADKLCVPIWYYSVLHIPGLSVNTEAMKDYEFTSQQLYNTEWESEVSPSGYNVNVQYSSTHGTHDNDGCVAITYVREETQPNPTGGKMNITLKKEFEFPYDGSPKSIWWHYSLFLDNRTQLPDFPVTGTISISRDSETFQIDRETFSISLIAQDWYSRAYITFGELTTIEERIFTQPGNYTYELTLTIADNTPGRTDMTIYVDNAQLLLYGKAYGLLGTSSVPEATPRDLFTMLVYGTRISFLIGMLTAVFSVLIGLVIGLVAGYVRGLVDEGLMRFADFLMVIPSLPLLIVLVTVLGRSIWNIIGVLIFMGWMGFSRSVRSMVLSLRERPFIESAKAAGAGTFYVIYRHILPNVFALVYISLATSVPGAIVSEASLAWLGLGDVTIPSWGIMLYDFSRTQTAIIKGIGEYWFWVIPPGVAIALMAMAFILMGFALDEILNPRLRRRL